MNPLDLVLILAFVGMVKALIDWVLGDETIDDE